MVKFAVLGDTHYRSDRHRPDAAHRRDTEGLPGPEGSTEHNYRWMVEHVWPTLLNEVRACHPDLVCQIGDFVDGGHDNYDGAASEMREALALLATLDCPIFVARGTHEGLIPRPGGYAFRQVVLPHLAQQLGRPLDRAYYSLEADGCRFVMLDYLTLNAGDEQHRWMEAELASAADRQRVFLFAHPPLVPVGRAFFSRLEFVRPVLHSLSRYPVDAYFCGHTHHQAVTLHRSSGRWFLQAMGTMIGFPDVQPNPLQRVRAILPPAADLEYYWGFQEDTAPSWFLVTVEEEQVTLDWHLLDRGVQGTLEWQESGCITRVVRPNLPTPFVAGMDGLADIVSGRLFVTGFAPGDSSMIVLLNGVSVGSVPQSGGFGPARGGRGLLSIPPGGLEAIGPDNELTIHNPERHEVCLGGLFLEATLADGRRVRTNVAPHVYATSHRWDNWGIGALHHVQAGEPIRIPLTW